MAPITIALAGNPNSGKTTLFNALTGSSQYVGNWPGVTVEKKEGRLKGQKDVTITDLPGIYSLSPYTLEEVVARRYLTEESPDAILNIVDGTNLERNLYLTTQLLELGIPTLVAVNMSDVVAKKGDTIHIDALSEALGCPVVSISALKGDGVTGAAEKAAALARQGSAIVPRHRFEGCVEHALAHIEELALHDLPEARQRWYAIKLLERDSQAAESLGLSREVLDHIERDIQACERELDDDAESIITDQRYRYITSIIGRCRTQKRPGGMTTSDKIDQVVTNRLLALPIFVAVMFLVYAIAMGGWGVSIGTRATDWANDGLFGEGWFLSGGDGYEEDAGAFAEASAVIAAYEAGETTAYLYDADSGETTALPVDAAAYGAALAVPEPNPADYGTWINSIPVVVGGWLESIDCASWLSGLIVDGIIGGVGAVLGFVPQMLVLFLLLAILEDCGYMARIAFIMDRLFRRFGLSGKSFIPMLVATGCGVPGIMASRTIEQDRDRKMTIMTTGFIPCGAKIPIIFLFAGALFGGSAWVATSAFFIGISAVVVSGIILKKTRAFAGDPAPFVMELPTYHAPTVQNVLRATWERGWSFIKRAGTVILLSSVILWFLQGFGFGESGFGMVEDNDASLLAMIGGAVCWIFAPLGFGTWQATVGTVTGLIAKENVVSTMQVLYPGDLSAHIAGTFTGISAYSFMIFNLLCAPCFAAMGAIKREMNDAKWTWAAIGYMCAFAYTVSLIVYQLGGLLTGAVGFGLGTAAAALALAGLVYLLFRRGWRGNEETRLGRRAVTAG